MKAIVFHKYGLPDVLELKEVDKPVPKENEVLIKVFAASINSWDWELLQGKPFVNRLVFGLFKPKKINILGCDLAGQVVAVGSGVKRFKVGDEVFGDVSGGDWGCFAEYACADEDVLAHKPKNMTFAQAAAMPQAGVLALQGLHYQGPINPGQKVLINGAGGGVGTFAIQMAKSAGAEVTGVDSRGKMELMSTLGADYVIGYTKEDFTKNGQCYDLILDNIVTRSVYDACRSLNKYGTYVVIGGQMSRIIQTAFLGKWIAKKEGKKSVLLMHRPNKDDLKKLASLYETGKIKPIVDKCYPMQGFAEAMQYFGRGQVLGKVVVKMET